MKILFLSLALAFSAVLQAQSYQPTPENMASRQAFSDARFGVFLHWGIYSMFAQGEWYMQNKGIPHEEYAKAARGFYPAHFDADAWVRAIKDAGAGYICFTTRHHDGFSLWNTAQSDYNIVKATPYGRDVLKELAEACRRHDIRLHLYYSHIDWGRPDYPMGRTGHGCKDSLSADWPTYYDFMNRQLTELLTQYGPVGAIWFDGWWDHDRDSLPFNWQLDEQYQLIHRLQPACLVGNNHHQTPNPGEDIQIFERDLPGENKAGLSGQSISRLPLETCETMNGMWGYRIQDQNYKSVPTLVRLLVGAAGKGANLLLNIGPQSSGELPHTAVERLQGMGQWMRQYGSTIRQTTAGPLPATDTLCTTQRGDTLFLHLLNNQQGALTLPLTQRVRNAKVFATGEKVPFKQGKGSVTFQLPAHAEEADYVIQLLMKK